MGRGGDNESFAQTINRASELPDDRGEGASLDLPTLFDFPIPKGEHVVTDEPDPKNIQGIPKYKFKAKLGRFIVGSVTEGFGPESTTTTYDDSAAYEALMNEILEGRAVLRWEERHVLKDGTIVLAMSWLVKQDPP